MKAFDRKLQSWRIKQASRFIDPGSRVLDIGCSDGELFEQIPHIAEGIGIDPLVVPSIAPGGRYRLVRGWFPAELPDSQPFDAITLLAVLEHIPLEKQAEFASQCFQHLKPGGRLIATVPSAAVDHILQVLCFLRIIDGMEVEQHYGFDVQSTTALFEDAGMSLLHHSRFELGLNHVFAFVKSEEAKAKYGKPADAN